MSTRYFFLWGNFLELLLLEFQSEAYWFLTHELHDKSFTPNHHYHYMVDFMN